MVFLRLGVPIVVSLVSFLADFFTLVQESVIQRLITFKRRSRASGQGGDSVYTPSLEPPALAAPALSLHRPPGGSTVLTAFPLKLLYPTSSSYFVNAHILVRTFSSGFLREGAFSERMLSQRGGKVFEIVYG